MSVNNRICALLLTFAACAEAGANAAAGSTPAQEADCAEVQESHRFRRPTHFSIKRDTDAIEYLCTLRKNRKKDPAVFRRECEAFVNKYIDILNRCEDAGLPRFALDEAREQSDRQDAGKYLKYVGMIHFDGKSSPPPLND